MKDIDLQPLAETLELRPYETASSLLARVAAREHAAHARQFASDFFVNFGRLAGGDVKELEKVAVLLSANYEELRRWTPRRVTNGFQLGGEVVTTYRSRRLRFRVCPVCAAEDITVAPGEQLDAAVSCRAFTLIDPIRTCFLHGVALVQVADKQSTGDHNHDFSLAIADALEDWDDLIRDPVVRAVSMFEWYLLGRLGFTQRINVELADELDITGLTSIAQYLGAFILKGRTAVLEDFDEDGLWAAAEAGFGVLVDGEEGVRRFVSDAFDRAEADGIEGYSTTVFDRFHYALSPARSAGHFDRIKQIIVDRLSELVPYGPDDAPLFGVRATKRHWHSFTSAEREHGVPWRTLRKLAKKSDLVRTLKTKNGKPRDMIAVDDVRLLLSTEGARVNRLTASRQLGATMVHFNALAEAGLLKPVHEGKHGHNALYLQSDIDRVARDIVHHATVQHGEVDGMVTLQRAAVWTAVPLPEIMTEVFRGALPCSSVTGENPVASVRVNLSVLEARDPFQGVEVLTVPEAASLLGVGHDVINRLALAERLPSSVRKHRNCSSSYRVIPRQEMLAFRERFIPTSEIWRRGTPLIHITPKLASMGIEPAFKQDEIGCRLYPREPVERGLFPG